MQYQNLNTIEVKSESMSGIPISIPITPAWITRAEFELTTDGIYQLNCGSTTIRSAYRNGGYIKSDLKNFCPSDLTYLSNKNNISNILVSYTTTTPKYQDSTFGDLNLSINPNVFDSIVLGIAFLIFFGGFFMVKDIFKIQRYDY